MKSITIHNLSDQLSRKIEDTARREGLSLNKTIKKLLEKSFGISSSRDEESREMFTEFIGVWSEEEANEFDHEIEDFETILSEDWQ